MSKHSRQALTLLIISALGVSTAVSIAQTVDLDAPAVEVPANNAVTEHARVRPAHFGGRAFGRRGGRGGAAMQFFADADANNDGSLTQAEVDQFLADQLTNADTDGDGAVGLEEFQVIYMERTRPRMVDAFQTLDDDGDGTVTAAELSDRFGAIIERLDRNGDDALSAEDRGRRGDRDGRRGRDRGDRR